jgi:energy-coupling factor transport system permease protein
MTAYSDRRSPIHALDPRVKIAWSVVVSMLAIILGDAALLAGLSAIAVAPWCLARPSLARLRLLVPLMGMTVLGTMISQGFFYGHRPRTELLTLLPGVSLCREGIVHGAIVSLRLLSVLAAGVLAVFTTHPSDLILAMAKLRVPHSFAFMLTLAMRFLPETVEQSQRISAAQRLRGVGGRGPASVFRRFRLSVIPLLVVSLRGARQVALAAEVRAYSANRVPCRELRFSAMDWAAMVAIVLLGAAGVTAALLGFSSASGGIG